MDALDTILDEAVEMHPAPSESAPELRAEAQTELVNDAAGSAGPPGWNPAIHVSPPVKTTRGSWKLLRGKTAQQTDADDAARADDPDAAAEALCDTVFGLLPGMLGDKWEPKVSERRNVQSALARYFRANGSIDIPPGMALVMAVGAYALPRTPAADYIGALTGAQQLPPAAPPTATITEPPRAQQKRAAAPAQGIPLDAANAAKFAA